MTRARLVIALRLALILVSGVLAFGLAGGFFGPWGVTGWSRYPLAAASALGVIAAELAISSTLVMSGLRRRARLLGPDFQVLTGSTIDETIRTGGALLVTFSSNWCPPCLRLAPC